MVNKTTVLPPNSTRTSTTVTTDLPSNRPSVLTRLPMAPKNVKKSVKRSVKVQKRVVRNRAPRPVFGPVATIDTAPVSIGNSVTGATPVVTPIEDGQRIQGRDFLLEIDPTAETIVDWTLVAASPIAPACMIASTLKHFSSTYAHYVIHGVAFHFITSSSTATNGSVMFYINKDRSRPALPTDSDNFMSAVLSDHNTVIGPLWKNTTASYFPEPVWFSTDVFDGEQMLSQCPGELLMYTKSANNEVPGYVLVDYDISFRGMSLNPKSGILPVSRMKYTQVTLTLPSTAVVGGSTPVILAMSGNNLLDGITASSAPTGATIGDIYKIIIDEDDSTITGANAGTVWAALLGGGYLAAQTITDGYTCYGVVTQTNNISIHPNFAAAQGTSNALRFNVTTTVSMKVPCYMSLCGSVGGLLSQASI